MKQKLSIVLVLFMAVSLYAQNVAHKEWDLLDKPVRRGMWIWKKYQENQDLMIDFCMNKSINEVYLYIGEYYWGQDVSIRNEEALAAFIEKANAAGIKVWGCYYFWDNEAGLDYLGDLDQDEHIEHARKVIDAAAAFNRKYPHAGLHGMQNDNEPKSDNLLVPYLEYCKAAHDHAVAWNDTLIAEGARPLLHSVALRPGWITSARVDYNGSNNYVAYHYLTECNHVTVMNYNSNGNIFKSRGETILQWADEIEGDQRVVLGVEVNDIIDRWPSAIYETYADEIQEEDDQTRFNVFEADMDSAELAFMNYQSYDRIAIHSFSGYIEHWFQGLSWDELAPAPYGTEFVHLHDDQSPWAEAIPRIEYAPVALGDTFTVTSERHFQSSFENSILANDYDYNRDTLQVQLEDDVLHGELHLQADGTFSYRSDTGFLGIDSFRYHVFDGLEQSEPAAVKILVIAEASPVSGADEYMTEIGEELVVSAGDGVLSNDSDLNMDSLSALLADSTRFGMLVLDSDGSFDYLPEEGFSGLDSFSYRAFDGLYFSDTTWVRLYVWDYSSGILVAYWPFDGNSRDYSGNELHGQASSGMGYVDGKLGEAICFTKNEHTVDIYSDSIPPPWSLSVWVKRTANHRSTHLIGNKNVCLKLEQWGTDSEVGYTQYGVKDYSFGYVVPLNTWTHLAISCDYTQLKLYVNGEEHSVIPGSFELGMDQMGETGRGQALGSLDDLAIWNRRLSAEEIDTIYTEAMAGISIGEKLGLVSAGPGIHAHGMFCTVFPNPAGDVVYLETLPDRTSLSLYSASGVCLSSGLYSGRAALDMSGHPGGMYFVRIESGGQSTVLKFTKY